MTCTHRFTRSDDFPFRYFCVKCCRFRIDIKEQETATIRRRAFVAQQDEQDARRWRALVRLAAMHGGGFEAAMREAMAEADKTT